MTHYLSKSDYKVAHDCPTKLFYKKKGYPNSNDEDEYLQHLASGGYMVGKLATLLYPDGIEIDTGSNNLEAIKKTQELLELKQVTIFEAAIESKGKIIRVDILEKMGDSINLIEVKSKSFETTSDEKKKKKIEKELEKYILDVAYQYYVIKEAYPNWEIKPFLFMPDKAKNTTIDGLANLFKIEQAFDSNSRFKRYNVTFLGNLTEIMDDDLLTLLNVEKRVLEFQPMINTETEIYLESLQDELKKIQHTLTKECFKCEFNLKNEAFEYSGYEECWADYPKVEHPISELYYIGSIGGNKRPLANELIQQKKISLSDIPLQSLTEGNQGKRQRIQINYTLENKEWISDNLKKEINQWEYPLHFIDFETTRTALPLHKGMRPYEVINFQWSCHTVKEQGAEPIHTEWINLEPSFPSFKFAESLMKVIGTSGTQLIWSNYENTMLKSIYEQYYKYEYNNDELKGWLEYMVKFNADDDGKFTDMNKMAVQSFFNPHMKGKTSIKRTLPAVLKSNNLKYIEYLLSNFEVGLSLLQKNEKREIIDPYQLLPSLEIYDSAETIKDGTGAMRAYEDIMFGLRKGNLEELGKYRQALLRYCKLDTLAMVIIWTYWNK